jgi:hypothetical protein
MDFSRLPSGYGRAGRGAKGCSLNSRAWAAFIEHCFVVAGDRARRDGGGTGCCLRRSITTRPEDYVELYERDGELVAVGWFDRFGIQRMAIDRAFVDGGDKLQGVFVAIVDGESV